MLTPVLGWIEQDKLWLVCHRYLWNCQSHSDRYFPDRWYRSLGSKEEFDRRFCLDGHYDVHHRSGPGHAPP